MTTYHQFRELVLRASWPSQSAALAGCRVLTYHAFANRTQPSTAPDWDLVYTDQGSVEAPPPDAEVIGQPEGGFQLRRSGENVYVVCGEFIARVSPSYGEVRGRLPTEGLTTNGHFDVSFYLSIVLPLTLLLQNRGLYVMHAAALGRPDGAGVLLIADSDSGKSTLSMALVREGWGYVSDDAILLGRRDARAIAFPFRRYFGLDPHAVHQFPEIASAQAPEYSHELKWSVEIESLYPTRRLSECTPALLIFPSIANHSASTLTPVSRKDAFVRILSQTSFADPALATQQIEVIRALVEQTRCFQLLAGTDVKENPQVVVGLLASIMP